MARQPNLAAPEGPLRLGALVVSPERGGGLVVAFWSLFLAAVTAISWLLPNNLVLLFACYGATALVLGTALSVGRTHLAGAAMASAAAVIFKIDLSQLSLSGKLWGIVAVAVCLLVFVAAPIHRTPGFPILHLYCLLQAVYLFLGAFVARPPSVFSGRFPPSVRVSGLVYSALFMATLVAAGLVVLRRQVSETADGDGEGDDQPDTARAVLLLMAGTVAAIAVARSPLATRIGSFADILRLVPVLGALGLVDLWLRGALELRLKALAVACGTVYALAGIGTGLLYRAAGPFIAVLALVTVRRKRIPWAVLAVALTATLVLNAGKAEFRRNYEFGRAGDGLAAAPEFMRATQRVLTDFDARILAEAAYRYSTSDVLGYIENAVPDRYPYWDRRSYKAIPFSLVPRVLVPFKPSLTFTNEFGRAYELLDPTDFVTSQNIPLAVEAYVNFGVPGLLGIGVIAGVFLGFLGRLIGRRRSADVVLGALIVAQVASAIESGALGFALAIPYVFILRPVARWMAPARSSPPARALDLPVPAP